MNKRTRLTMLLILLPGLMLSSCEVISEELSQGEPEGLLQASGIIEVQQIAAAPEMSGKVSEVLVSEGDRVEAGDALLRLDPESATLQLQQARAQHQSALAQLKGARSGLDAAEAARAAAETRLASAEINYQLTLRQARAAEAETRAADWHQNQAAEIDLPAWYFNQEELIRAAKVELEQVEEFFRAEQEHLNELLDEIDSEEILNAEQRLAEAQAAFQVAVDLQNRPTGAEGREEIDAFVETLSEAAEAELEAAQTAFDQNLTDPEFQELLEARVRLSVAQERLDLARDAYAALQTGEHSLEVQAARAAVREAEAGLRQAETGIDQAETSLESARQGVHQAESALALAELQLDKQEIIAPAAGTVLTRAVDPGETVQAGMTSLMLGNLDELTVKVYLPGDRYGQVSLGDRAEISVDSFPDETFSGTVSRIADQAEFTPRNVQTKEERQHTVYAVELRIENPDGKLKPGMPVDVVFQP